ncbi:hypothetical protein NM208_g1259 [Fusarium decemcellulare]|uniref:Uncharacterized protein n=1 Tax=Fusarium decemcellulare TaxID=57161 RepID=A0ACC1SWN0_9HYPO|nr:hypothetical protein NM208_g1259 [Fusarium decemcellulare]
MSPFSIYDGTVPHVTAAMNTLLHLFDQMEAHASKHNTHVDALLGARLAEDMASSLLLGTLALESLKTLDDMRKRVRTALEFAQSADRQKFVDIDVQITFDFGPKEKITTNAYGFANGYAVPNMYFHVVTAYDILRKHGISSNALTKLCVKGSDVRFEHSKQV